MSDHELREDQEGHVSGIFDPGISMPTGAVLTPDGDIQFRDPEIQAMAEVLTALTELPEATQGRVMRWVQDRLAQENHAKSSGDLVR